MSEPVNLDSLILPVLESVLESRTRMPVTRRGPRSPISEWVRINVFLRDEFTCQWCGRSDKVLHLDHIVPWSAGGTDASDNLRALCEPCNLDRSNYATDSEHARKLVITNGCATCCPDFFGDERDIGTVAVWCAWCRTSRLTDPNTRDSYRSEQITHTGFAAKHVRFERRSKANGASA